MADLRCSPATAAPLCHGNPDRCAAASAQPDVERRFDLSLSPYRGGDTLGAEEIRTNWECAHAELRRANIPIVAAEDEQMDRLTVVASFRSLEPLLSLSAITGIEVNCTGDCACEELSIDECQSNAFCRTLPGSPVDAARDCSEAAVTVGCLNGDAECGDAISFASAPGGRCHQFTSTCVPPGWSACTPPERGYAAPCP